MSKKIITSAIITCISLIIFITSSVSSAPLNTVPEIKITSIRAGDSILDETHINHFSISKDSQLIVYFKVNNAPSQVFFRIFLDGIMVESKYEGQSYSLVKLTNGAHVFKILPYTSDLSEGVPAVFSFTVVEPIKQVTSKVATSAERFSVSMTLVYVLAGVIFIQLIIIIVVLVRRREPKQVKTITEDVGYELHQAKRSHKNALDELKRQTDENEYLREQIKVLNSDIQLLETTNVRLVEQKEKLTESKHKLELLQSQKEELFTIAVHDIKNPASAIRGYIELLNSYDLNATEQHEIMTSLVETSESIVQMSQSMCTLITKNMPEPKYKMILGSVVGIVNDVCMQNASYAKSKKVKLENKSLHSLPDVKMDAEKIEEALDNLVNNAIKYAPPETNVEVRTFIRDGNKKFVAIEVKDSGVGLSEADLKKSFQKGVMLTPKPTGLEQSSGLGLWIVKKIIEEHGGRVYVNSKEGFGSTFGFELPLD